MLTVTHQTWNDTSGFAFASGYGDAMPGKCRHHNITNTIHFEVITDWSGLGKLQDEWNALWRRARHAFALQTFAAADLIYRTPLHGRSTQIWCLVGRVEGELALVWPFTIHRNHGWRLAAPLAGDLDCSDPLIVDDPACFHYAREAWAYTTRECPCDLFHIQFVRRHMPLHDLIELAPSRVLIYDLELPLVEFSGGWGDYQNQLSKKQHSGFARKRRRLLELGNIRFEQLPCDTPELTDWIVEHKKKWLAGTGLPDRIRLTRPRFAEFLRGVLQDLGPRGHCQVFAIRQGERLVAADVNFADQRTLQWYVGTFDEEFGKYSPGQLLKEYVVHWALDRGLIYDMLGGTGQHKNYLATKVEQVTTWRIGRTKWGRCYVWLRRWLAKFGLLK
jgi:CelD/BcsL family acetyltransferase involved in cellulose biosynthesis